MHKKVFVIIIVALTMVLLAGCGNDENNEGIREVGPISISTPVVYIPLPNLIQAVELLWPEPEPALQISATRSGPDIEVSKGYIYEIAVLGVVSSGRDIVLFPIAIRVIDTANNGCIRLVFFRDIGIGQDQTVVVVYRRTVIVGSLKCGTTLLSWIFPLDA